ncbi:MAG: mechanosensitive ion channel domain-containing protein [Verrucomicrobiota bacterium]
MNSPVKTERPFFLLELLKVSIRPFFFLIILGGVTILFWKLNILNGFSLEVSQYIQNLGIAAVAASLTWMIYGWIGVFEKRLVEIAEKTVSSIDDFIYPFIGITLRAFIPPLLISWIFVNLLVPLPFQNLVGKIPSLVVILSIGWWFYQMVTRSEHLIRRRIELNPNLESRTVITRVQLLRQIFLVIICFMIIAASLMLFDSVRRLGTSLLASAGVAGIVLGLAAQRTFSTIIAGIQIALTQPIRIGDQINAENEFGTVEEITLTYVVIKLWDLRRLMLPINYFIEHPFQNWTRTSSNVVGAVFLRVDFSAPIQELREEFNRIVRASKHWNQNTCALHVSDADEVSLQIRLIASAPTAAQSWELRCEIREKMVDFIRRHYPLALPRARNEQKAVTVWNDVVNFPERPQPPTPTPL